MKDRLRDALRRSKAKFGDMSMDSILANVFNPDQRRGPDGRWIRGGGAAAPKAKRKRRADDPRYDDTIYGKDGKPADMAAGDGWTQVFDPVTKKYRYGWSAHAMSLNGFTTPRWKYARKMFNKAKKERDAEGLARGMVALAYAKQYAERKANNEDTSFNDADWEVVVSGKPGDGYLWDSARASVAAFLKGGSGV